MAEPLRWRKSSYSGPNDNCVEVANLSGAVAVRDSKVHGGPVLRVASMGWTSFVAGIRIGAFDQ